MSKIHDFRRFSPPEGDDLRKAQELAESDRRGTIHEATAMLLKETGELINIETAVRSGQIPSYAPGSCKPLPLPNEREIAALDEEEVYADELNAWLDTHYPRVKFRFQKVGAGGTAKVSVGNMGVTRRKRGALIKEVEPYWPTIKEDLRHSDTNELTAAAKLPEHGFWNSDAAIQWARERGKIIEDKVSKAPKNVSPWAMATGNLQK